MFTTQDGAYMPEPNETFQEQVAALRRAQILDAATKVFAARGFHRTTIRDVAKAAGVADGTIYNYFENKTALLLGILNRLNETERRDEDLAQSADHDVRDFSRHYFRHRFSTLTQGGLEVLQVVLSEVLVSPELRELYTQQVVAPTFALAEAHFTRLAETGKIRQLDIPLTLRALSATVLGLLILRIMGDPQLQAKWDELPDLLTTLMLDGLLPTEAAAQDQ
jgi:TetR/AcrR family fatty acid metabolism transcriptional regulator